MGKYLVRVLGVGQRLRRKMQLAHVSILPTKPSLAPLCLQTSRGQPSYLLIYLRGITGSKNIVMIKILKIESYFDITLNVIIFRV